MAADTNILDTGNSVYAEKGQQAKKSRIIKEQFHHKWMKVVINQAKWWLTSDKKKTWPSQYIELYSSIIRVFSYQTLFSLVTQTNKVLHKYGYRSEVYNQCQIWFWKFEGYLNMLIFSTFAIFITQSLCHYI